MADEYLEGMDEFALQDFLRRFGKNEGQGGDEDFQDFLVNYMNAMNRGATENQIKQMLGGVSQERAEPMYDRALQGRMFSPESRAGEMRGDLTDMLRNKVGK